MGEPRPGRTTFLIMVSPLPGGCCPASRPGAPRPADGSAAGLRPAGGTRLGPPPRSGSLGRPGWTKTEEDVVYPGANTSVHSYTYTHSPTQ
ncbi:cuticle collagen 19-like [Cervus elaphus]|uniref:cuticle collagen 19-like n=1 Tax=Cervus elaphus TaxID=9860 RepID=UPI001C9E4BCF|nr:cuticle collagen 19-like isoform X2 [Cervus canadensis]XP_043772457.1 cuticle collagen 19-like [Cervus elaphus]XP_043772458.1 cuticle collagen 19-like [Cervus elaphus]